MVPSPFNKFPTPPEFMSHTTRDWHILYFDQQQLSRDFRVEIFLKSRNEAPLSTVPERLFSSLKYEVRHKISGSFTKNVPLLMCKITLIHPETGQEVISKRKEKEPILKGVTEGALIHDENGNFVFNSKIQITDVSFHYGKKYFAFQIVYYIPTKLDTPLLMIRSAPFQVYARRMNGKRRKREQKPQPYIAEYPLGISKKQKRPTIQDFLRGLDELIVLRSKLRSDLQRKAVEAIVRKLLIETPERKIEPQRIQVKLPTPQITIPPSPIFEQMSDLDLNSLFADFDKLLEKEYNRNGKSNEIVDSSKA